MHGNLVVGLIVFAILVTIQFVVIASGSQRVAEVAARFTLDAMPGKQMAIDADVHAGAFDAEGARRKREAVQREADFYGAMDGAGKFVKGDAVAALVIVALNLAGGIVVGIAYHGLSPLDAINTFALLSIGNALVTTLPAFLISTAMGMMVTRVASDGALGADLAAQLFARPDVLRSAGGLLFVLALVPALPRPLFLTLGRERVRAWRALRSAVAGVSSASALERARARQAQRDAPPGTRSRTGRRRRGRNRDRRRPRATARRRRSPMRCSIASAKFGARLRRISASSFPACVCATIFRATRARYGIRVRDRLVGERASRARADCSPSPTKRSSRASRYRSRASRSTDCPSAWIPSGRARERDERRRAGFRSDLRPWFASRRDRAHACVRARWTSRVADAARTPAIDRPGAG